ncbi:MAG: glycosyltransferase [Cyanobacteria bacterium J06598_3]
MSTSNLLMTTAETVTTPPTSPTQKVDVTVAIPTYNGAKKLPALLEKLRSQTRTEHLNWEIIVCDRSFSNRAGSFFAPLYVGMATVTSTFCVGDVGGVVTVSAVVMRRFEVDIVPPSSLIYGVRCLYCFRLLLAGPAYCRTLSKYTVYCNWSTEN